MDFTGFLHETKSKYAYAVDAHTLHLRLRTGRNAAEAVTLISFDPFNWVERADKPGVYVFNMEKCQRLPMRKEYTAGCFDYWFAEVTVPAKRCKYGFWVRQGTNSFLYGPQGPVPFTDESAIGEMTGLFYLYPYILLEDIFQAPPWVKDTVWYQIFPERYANSGAPNLQKGTLLPWGSEPEVNNRQRYGGDLPGVIAHLDELNDLGVTGLYFTPIFTSPSTHKYNTEDYFQIDPAFGDNAVFGTLMREAHKRGIRVMLDLVFNHIGATHPFWLDVLEKGKASRYYDCFYLKQADLTVTRGQELPYETFAHEAAMPKWNTSNPFARQYLLDVAVYWARTYGVDGFRLDVANEVSHDFWRVFRQTVRAVNPELYIVGEVWDNAAPWLQGDQFDAVMNYTLAGFIGSFVSGKTDGAGLCDQASAYLASYPKNQQSVMFNLIGSHDTSRIMTVARGRVERVMQAFTLLFTFAGAPCILYGDEVGLTGDGMDRARQCMIWDEARQNRVLLDFVKRLVAWRKTIPAMKTVDVYWRRADKTGVLYEKRHENGTLAVAINALDDITDIPTPSDWIDGTGLLGIDLLRGESVKFDKTLRLEPYGIGLWLLKGKG